MNQEDFRIQLADEGFKEITLVEREPNRAIADHAHPFEAKALILSGDIRIRTGGAEQTYRAGDIFHLQANQEHQEFYGAAGVTYLVGRK